MEKRVTIVISLAFLFFSVGGAAALAAANRNISGSVRDAQTGEVLPGANILIVGTSLGGASDIKGQFLVQDVPPGSYTLRASYLGYTTKEAAGTAHGGCRHEDRF